MTNNFKPISKSSITSDEFTNFIEYFPALLWRIDIVENKIEYLNNHHITGLGDQSGLILQNMAFSRRMILDEDFHLLEQFMQAVRDGKTAATIFRIQIETGDVTWIKVTGTVYRKHPRYYLGYMLDVSDTVGIVQNITEHNAEQAAMIESLDYPVVLLNAEDRSVMAQNAAARELFDYRPGEFAKLKSDQLFHPKIRYQLNRLFEDVVFEKKWEGPLVFQRKKNSAFTGETTVRYLTVHDQRLFRVSIHGISKETGFVEPETAISGSTSPVQPSQHAENDYRCRLMETMGSESDMERILMVLLENQHESMGFDSIIYSDVYMNKNKVVVYTAGKPLSDMKQGEVFSYQGTIAENIERYGLDHLIMEDTFSSIKAIDWALFIPHGLRSYFAKPFYERKKMRTVLVICSAQKNRFSEKNIHEYALLYDAFLKGLKNWRRAAKKRQTALTHR